MRAFEHAVTLNEVHAFQWNVETRIVGVLQEHELAAMPVGFDLTKSLELPDAVVHMDHIIAGLQFGKIAEETRSANFAAGPFDRGRDIKKVGMTEKRKPGIGKRDAFREGGADQQHRGGFVRGLGGEAGGGIFRFTENVGDFVFAADFPKAPALSVAPAGPENT